MDNENPNQSLILALQEADALIQRLKGRMATTPGFLIVGTLADTLFGFVANLEYDSARYLSHLQLGNSASDLWHATLTLDMNLLLSHFERFASEFQLKLTPLKWDRMKDTLLLILETLHNALYGPKVVWEPFPTNAKLNWSVVTQMSMVVGSCNLIDHFAW